jgi:hypothetical protein
MSRIEGAKLISAMIVLVPVASGWRVEVVVADRRVVGVVSEPATVADYGSGAGCGSAQGSGPGVDSRMPRKHLMTEAGRLEKVESLGWSLAGVQ